MHVWHLDQELEATVPDVFSPIGCGGLGMRLCNLHNDIPEVQTL